jgi:L-alanine-DL-glutamate epimerase-like enolase superfamily enzyme
VVAELSDGHCRGRGECVPYARYGETVESVVAAIETMAGALARGRDRNDLQRMMPPGAARNALDCAFWDLAAKQAGRRLHELLDMPAPQPLVTAYTISLGSPHAMAEAAAAAADRPLLKIKLGRADDRGRIMAVRAAAPHCELIVDANEGWTPQDLPKHLAACAEARVAMVEQPLPAGGDEALADLERSVPVCADESAHARESLPTLSQKYDAVNIKLDKAGGLTEALAMAKEAQDLGFTLMVGCMVSTSLAIAPAMLVGQGADLVDLDGPLLLECDRPDGLRYDGSLVHPASEALWG